MPGGVGVAVIGGGAFGGAGAGKCREGGVWGWG